MGDGKDMNSASKKPIDSPPISDAELAEIPQAPPQWESVLFWVLEETIFDGPLDSPPHPTIYPGEVLAENPGIIFDLVGNQYS